MTKQASIQHNTSQTEQQFPSLRKEANPDIQGCVYQDMWQSKSSTVIFSFASIPAPAEQRRTCVRCANLWVIGP